MDNKFHWQEQARAREQQQKLLDQILAQLKADAVVSVKLQFTIQFGNIFLAGSGLPTQRAVRNHGHPKPKHCGA
jgi:hypothetical protein